MPSFVVGEYLFIACAVAALVHALRQGDQRRVHVLAWVAALLTGSTNDVIFQALPVVDNFWHAQATIMLSARMPLYIPCVYVCFLYFPTVSVWRMNLPALPRAALSALATGVFYAPYDMIGAKFLWWTWHASDKPIAQRLLGVPIGSTMFAITLVAAFSLLFGGPTADPTQLSARQAAKRLALACGLTTPLMLVQITAFQQLDGGVPGIRGLVAILLIYAAVAWAGLRRRRLAVPRREDGVLHRAVVAYFATFVMILLVFDPSTHRSESIHQTFGPCRVEAKDITGLTRYKYLCAEDNVEAFSLDCVDKPPPDGSTWYTVCGRPHTRFARLMAAVVGFGALGTLLYSYLLGAFRLREREGERRPSGASPG
jgi:hypothetical protein